MLSRRCILFHYCGPAHWSSPPSHLFKGITKTACQINLHISHTSSHQWKHNSSLELSPSPRKKKVKFKTLWQSAFIKPWAQATVWIIKDFGASIDHQTISLGAKGIQESTFKNTSPLCARKVLTAFPCDWRSWNTPSFEPNPSEFFSSCSCS